MMSQTLLIELTDGQSTKPVQISVDDTTSLQLLKREGKKKFRMTFLHCCFRNAGGEDQYLETDEQLRNVLGHFQEGGQRGTPCFFLSNKKKASSTTTAAEQGSLLLQHSITEHAISFIIGNEADTEGIAVTQLQNAASLQGCIFAIGMPDLHAGKGIPIGACVLTHASTAYPQLVDNDIGCGMSFVETHFSANKFASSSKVRRLAERLESIDCPFADTATVMELCSRPLKWGDKHVDPLPDLPDESHYNTLGTIGGGNHFAELQVFEELFEDAKTLKEQFGIDTTRLHMLVHSGSRSLGAQYLREFCDKAAGQQSTTSATAKSKNTADANVRTGHFAADTQSPLFQEYLSNHDTALNFAVRNRRLIAKRLLDQISSGIDDDDAEEEYSDSDAFQCKIDIHHNFMERIQLTAEELQVLRQMEQKQGLFPKEIPEIPRESGLEASLSPPLVSGWLHRKGATPTTSRGGLLVIPGSRGSLSYLVQVNASLQHGSGYSLAHGAGRRMTRSKARALHKNQYPVVQQLLQTDLGGVVVCEKKDLVYEEAPASYKDIDRVVKCLAQDIRRPGGTDGGSCCGDDADDGSEPSAAKAAVDTGLVRILATLRPVLTYKYKDPYN